MQDFVSCILIWSNQLHSASEVFLSLRYTNFLIIIIIIICNTHIS